MTGEGRRHDQGTGPQVPEPGDPWTYDVYMSRWPFATKVELMDGAPYWQTDHGPWDEQDVQAAERAFPGWRAVLLHDGHVLTLTPPGEPGDDMA